MLQKIQRKRLAGSEHSKTGKNGKCTKDASPLEWEVALKDYFFIQFNKRRRGTIADESRLANHTNYHNTLLASLLYEVPTH